MAENPINSLSDGVRPTASPLTEAAASTGQSFIAGDGKPRILLVDDDPFMLHVQLRMLRELGLPETRTAESAVEALRLLQQEDSKFDIIVCDLNMPGMDGIEFLKSVATGDFSGHVVLVSGEGSHIMHTVQKLLGGGAITFLGALEKPVGSHAMRALLDCWRPRYAQKERAAQLKITLEDVTAAASKNQWVLHYQPKVDFQSRALVGVEALVRWNHPTHGVLYPDLFLDLAENCGVMDALTDWVLGEAMRQLVEWQRTGLQIKMSVNVSMTNLGVPGFAQRAVTIARKTHASPRDVILEVTESKLMGGSLVPLENLVRLRMQRFALSIDDFGTGHSSLVQLRDAPFTELKVDRGFVHGARNNQIIRPILEGSIGIAKRLRMVSVAEGVENEDDWQLLRDIGCDIAQGWFIGRPMTPDRLLQWLESWTARGAVLGAP